MYYVSLLILDGIINHYGLRLEKIILSKALIYHIFKITILISIQIIV